MSYQRQIKLEHFHNLIAVAIADGVIDESEKEFLIEKAEEFDLPESEVNKLIKNADKLQFMVPMNTEDGEDQLADIVFMMMVDGNIDQREYNLCMDIAIKLGLEKDDLDHVVDLTKQLWDKAQ